jgi:hypothetical protein
VGVVCSNKFIFLKTATLRSSGSSLAFFQKNGFPFLFDTKVKNTFNKTSKLLENIRIIFNFVATKTVVMRNNKELSLKRLMEISKMKDLLRFYKQQYRLSADMYVIQHINQWACEKGLIPFMVEWENKLSNSLGKDITRQFSPANYNLVVLFLKDKGLWDKVEEDNKEVGDE